MPGSSGHDSPQVMFTSYKLPKSSPPPSVPMPGGLPLGPHPMTPLGHLAQLGRDNSPPRMPVPFTTNASCTTNNNFSTINSFSTSSNFNSSNNFITTSNSSTNYIFPSSYNCGTTSICSTSTTSTTGDQPASSDGPQPVLLPRTGPLLANPLQPQVSALLVS